MSTMVIEFYEALLEAGASKEKATKAAQVASTFVRENDVSLLGLATDMGEVKTDISAVKEDIHRLDTRLEVVETELRMVKWVVNGVGFGMILLLLQNFLQ